MISLFGSGLGRCLSCKTAGLPGGMGTRKLLFCGVFPRATGSCRDRPGASCLPMKKARPQLSRGPIPGSKGAIRHTESWSRGRQSRRARRILVWSKALLAALPEFV